LAEPLKILENNQGVIDKLIKLISQEEIDLVLMGISENVMAEKTKAFARELEKNIDVPLEFADETLSSQSVHKKLASSHMKLKKRQDPIDHYAAAEILQEWLEINQ